MNEKHFCLLRLPRIDNALPWSFSGFFFSATMFLEYRRNWSKKKFTEQSKANTFHLFISIEEYFSGLFFFLTKCSEKEFPRYYLINAATCLSADF